MKTRYLGLVGLLLLVIAPVHAQDSLRLPTPTGSYAVGRTEYHIVDPLRPEIFSEAPDDVREWIVTVHYPADPAPDATPAPYLSEAAHTFLADFMARNAALVDQLATLSTHSYVDAPLAISETRFPIVIFSPSAGDLPIFYTSMVENLASHGMVVFTIWHTYSMWATFFPDGRVIGTSRGGMEQTDGVVDVWAEDIRLTLDYIEAWNDTDFMLQLDLSQINGLGHQSGGSAVIRAANLDPRIQRLAVIASTLFGDTRDTPIAQPSLWVLEGGIPFAYSRLVTAGYTLQIENTLGSFLFLTDWSLITPPLTDFPALPPSVDALRPFEVFSAYLIGFFEDALPLEQALYPEATLIEVG